MGIFCIIFATFVSLKLFQNNESLKTHQTSHLRLMHFTVYKLSAKVKVKR